MRRYINCKERGIKFNSVVGLKVSVQREESLVDDFYTEKVNIESKEVVFFRDPLYVLFNQKRLNQLSTEQIREWLNSMTAIGESSLSALKSKCSDDELIQMVRSRYLQTPAEITLWCREMNRNQDEFNSQLKLAKETIQANKAAQELVDKNVESKLE